MGKGIQGVFGAWYFMDNAFSARVFFMFCFFFLFHALGRRENVLMISALVLFCFISWIYHITLLYLPVMTGVSFVCYIRVMFSLFLMYDSL